MTFWEYIKHRREELRLHQEGLGGFGQAYISAIELGAKRPTRRKTIDRLAKALNLSNDQATWLWVYSLLNEEPRAFFARHGLHDGKRPERAQIVQEDSVPYLPDNNSGIVEGETPAEIQAKLGPPDKNLYFRNKRKWVYQDLGVQVFFEDDQVVDVVFK